MNLDGNVRLDQVLEQLGYKDEQQSHHRSNLLHAIELFAAANHDEYLSLACRARINLIRAELVQEWNKLHEGSSAANY